MLTQKYRPKTFDDICGQSLTIETLRAVSRHPEKSPRVFIFHGSFGCGKTSSAQVLARALNCEDGAISKRPCGLCKVCKDDLDFVPFYREFDCAEVGNVDKIRALKDEFFLDTSVCKYRVIVLDETQLVSRQGQSALLKTLEEMAGNFFVVFSTTDVDKIIPTIRSRSVELVFMKVSEDDIVGNLKKIVSAEKLEIKEETLRRIALHSRGHVRNAVMTLDKMLMIGNEEEFLKGIHSSEVGIIKVLLSAKLGDRPRLEEAIASVCAHPLDLVRTDYFEVLRKAIQGFVIGSVDGVSKSAYEALVEHYQQDLFKLLSYSTAGWALNTFRSDLMLQAFFWSLLSIFESASDRNEKSLLDRARKIQ